jgi:scyllo-inositol 2-dehydrogenase (NADP+)
LRRKIKTALLSFGLSGKVFHAPFLSLHPGFELVGCWERSKKVFGEKYPGTRSYATLEELLADRDVELVIVNTPTYTHYDYARQTLLAGKHAVVEKAFTATHAEAKDLKSIADKKGLKLSVFQNRRWDSDFKTIRKVVEGGLLGNIVEATLSYDRYNPVLSPKVHKETLSPGSGVVKDLGPHVIDQALVLFGMPVSVFGDIMTTRAGSQVPDYFEILLQYPQHRVRLRAGYFVREPVPSFVFHGRKGSFLKTRADVQEVRLLAGDTPGTEGMREPDSERGLLHTEKDGVVVREHVETLPGNYLAYYEGVYEAIANGKPMPVTAEDGINVMRIIEAAEISSREKRVVTITQQP